MASREQTTEVLVIGAGMAGLIAAGEIRRAGRSVTVLDKGRGVGGRLASRRIEGETFDHGARGFALGDPRWIAVGLRDRLGEAVAVWPPVAITGDAGHGLWRGTPSMSAIARHLAQGLEVHLETTVTALRPEEDRWVATTLDGGTFRADAVILTPPVPQALAMLDAGGFFCGPELRSRLDAIIYDPCLVVMALLDRPSRIPPPVGLAPASGPVAWITDNLLKGISSKPAVTLHATPGFSRENWDRERLETGRTLLSSVAEWLGSGIRTFQIHGWRYSQPRVLDRDPCLLINACPPLVLAGDAFGQGIVEGAAHSGWTAAGKILAHRPHP